MLGFALAQRSTRPPVGTNSPNVSQHESTGPGVTSDGSSNAEAVPTNEPDRPSQKMYISRLGRVLADLTTRRIILLTLLVVLLLPFLDPNFSVTFSDAYRFNGLRNLQRFSQDSAVAPRTFDTLVADYGLQAGRLLFVSVCAPPSDCLVTHTPEELAATIRAAGGGRDLLAGVSTRQAVVDILDDEFRESEYEEYLVTGCVDTAGAALPGTCEAVSFVSVRHLAQKDAQFSIYKTLFVIAVIVLGAVLFTRDAEVLVIRPIERMTALVMELARNPLKSITAIRRSIRQQYGFEDVSARRMRGHTRQGSELMREFQHHSSMGSGALRRSGRGNLLAKANSDHSGTEDISPQTFLNEEK